MNATLSAWGAPSAMGYPATIRPHGGGPSMPGTATSYQAWTRNFSPESPRPAAPTYWGDATGPTTEDEGTDWTKTAQSLLPAAASLTEALTDPYRRAELLKVRIAQARAQGHLSTVPRLQAELRAAQHRIAEDDAQDAALAEAGQHARALSTAGIVAIGALAIFLLAATVRVVR